VRILSQELKINPNTSTPSGSVWISAMCST
jgi:hypothetical protein